MLKNIRVYFGKDAMERCAKLVNRAYCRKVFDKMMQGMTAEDHCRVVKFLSGLPGTGRKAMLCEAMRTVPDKSQIAYITIKEPASSHELITVLNILWDSSIYSSREQLMKEKDKIMLQPLEPEEEELIDICFGEDKKAIKYVFVDNIENVEDFMRNSKSIGDIYAHSMNIVIISSPMITELAVTDPFLLNAIVLNTTYISYGEWHCISGSDDYGLFLKKAGVKELESGTEYLKEMLADMDRAIASNDRGNAGIWHDMAKLHGKNIFVDAGIKFLRMSVLRFLHDILKRNFRKEPLALKLDEIIMEKIFSEVKILTDWAIRQGAAESFFKMLESLGIGRLHRIYDLGEFDANKPEISESEMWLKLIIALEKYYDPAEKDKAIDFLNSPKWLFFQPALRHNLAMGLVNELWRELALPKSGDFFTNLCAKVRANSMLETIWNDAWEACPTLYARSYRDHWELDSINTQWGFIDLIATYHGEWHSEVFVFAETAESDPEKLLSNPELRKMLLKRYSGPCSYYILYTGEDKQGIDGIKWLNLGEFLCTLPERWQKVGKERKDDDF